MVIESMLSLLLLEGLPPGERGGLRSNSRR